jgi:regulator of replication initiation timing
LKKKNQELEKFKFVLDYKITELKRQIEPRENEIQQMLRQIQEMDRELEGYHLENNKLDLEAKDLKQKLAAAERDAETIRNQVQDSKILVQRFKVDFNDCMRLIDDPRELKVRFIFTL